MKEPPAGLAAQHWTDNGQKAAVLFEADGSDRGLHAPVWPWGGLVRRLAAVDHGALPLLQRDLPMLGVDGHFAVKDQHAVGAVDIASPHRRTAHAERSDRRLNRNVATGRTFVLSASVASRRAASPVWMWSRNKTAPWAARLRFSGPWEASASPCSRSTKPTFSGAATPL